MVLNKYTSLSIPKYFLWNISGCLEKSNTKYAELTIKPTLKLLKKARFSFNICNSPDKTFYYSIPKYY